MREPTNTPENTPENTPKQTPAQKRVSKRPLPTPPQRREPDTPTRPLNEDDIKHFLAAISLHKDAIAALDLIPDDERTLTAQTALLHGIFTNITLAHLAHPPDYNDDDTLSQLNWIMLALKAQTLCTKAISAKATKNYTDTLTAVRKSSPAYPDYFSTDPYTGLGYIDNPPLYEGDYPDAGVRAFEEARRNMYENSEGTPPPEKNDKQNDEV